MKHNSLRSLALCFLSIMAFSSTRSNADIAITARETGGNVVFSYSGSIQLTGLGESQATSAKAAVYPVNAYVEFGPLTAVPESGSLYLNSVVTADSVVSIGTGGYQPATSASGSYFSVNNNSIKLPLGYTSGSMISGSMTFQGKSLADLQVTGTETPAVWVLTNGQRITFSTLDAGNDNDEAIAELERKIKRVKREIRIAKAAGQTYRVKKLTKKLRWLKSELEKLESQG